MSNQEILEKAIQKAIDGGWKDGKDYLSPISQWNDEYHYFEWLGDHGYYSLEQLIFNHDFAKALFGDEEHTTEPGMEYISCKNCDVDDWAEFCWEAHLQAMVISDDPIKYLGGNI